LAEWAVDRFRSEFLLLRSRVGEKKARQVLKDLLKRPAQRPPGPTNPEHDEELLKIVNVLTKERPISIKQAAKEIHEAFPDRYKATAESVETRIRRLMKK